MRKIRKTRKKGSLIVEFLVILPVLVFVVWAGIQMVFYLGAQATIHQAAMNAATITATELRGHIGSITDASVETQAIITEKIGTKLQHITKYNAVLLLYRDREYGWLDANDVPILLEPTEGCDNLDSYERVICIYTDTDGSSSINGKDEEMVVVKIKAKFRVIGTLLPSIEYLDATGNGSAVKEQAERFQYIVE